MKRFLFNTLFFSMGISVLLVGYVYTFTIGNLDFYYNRISSPKQTSLVIGNSRSAQGIVPSVLNSETNNEYNFYNFSFTANYSPYGKPYYQAIKNKVAENTTNGIFIVTVDPGSISGPKENPEDESLFIDNKSFLANISCVDCNPNIGYILYRHETYYRKIFYNLIRGKGYLHKDGWLEMKLANDSVSRYKRLEQKLSDENYATEYSISNTRIDYLKKTLHFLNKHGKVYLIRLPMHDQLMQRQEKAVPDFEAKMISLSKEIQIPYKSFKEEANNYTYTDGSHLTSESAKKISKDIILWIKTQNK